MTEHGETGLLMGTGLRKNPAFFAELVTAHPGWTLLDEIWDNPAPDALLKAAEQAVFTHESVGPIYVRPSDAEDNLEQIAKKRGMDPIEARKRLNALREE